MKFLLLCVCLCWVHCANASGKYKGPTYIDLGITGLLPAKYSKSLVEERRPVPFYSGLPIQLRGNSFRSPVVGSTAIGGGGGGFIGTAGFGRGSNFQIGSGYGYDIGYGIGGTGYGYGLGGGFGHSGYGHGDGGYGYGVGYGVGSRYGGGVDGYGGIGYGHGSYGHHNIKYYK